MSSVWSGRRRVCVAVNIESRKGFALSGTVYLCSPLAPVPHSVGAARIRWKMGERPLPKFERSKVLETSRFRNRRSARKLKRIRVVGFLHHLLLSPSLSSIIYQ